MNIATITLDQVLSAAQEHPVTKRSYVTSRDALTCINTYASRKNLLQMAKRLIALGFENIGVRYNAAIYSLIEDESERAEAVQHAVAPRQSFDPHAEHNARALALHAAMRAATRAKPKIPRALRFDPLLS
jgi:hypothetical protein